MEEKNAEDYEEKLLTYVKSVLKHQVCPMDFMRLRKLIKEAPQHLRLYPYIQEKYPAQDFLNFLRKYPNIFLVNPDNTVQSYEAAFCLMPPKCSDQVDSNCDEVDGYDKGEYISDDEESDREANLSDSDDSNK